jgi:hypothetical protein
LERPSQYEAPYSIQHPVKSRYDRLVTGLGDLAKFSGLLRHNLGSPGEGIEYRTQMENALLDVSILEAEISCYFSKQDFLTVFPYFSRETVLQDVVEEEVRLETVGKRRLLIQEICEANHWFEDQGKRLTAEEIPEN